MTSLNDKTSEDPLKAPQRYFKPRLLPGVSLSFSPCLNFLTSVRPETSGTGFGPPSPCQHHHHHLVSTDRAQKNQPPPSPTLFSSCASFSQTIGQNLFHLRGARCDDYAPLFTSLQTKMAQFSQRGDSLTNNMRQFKRLERQGGALGSACTALLE